MEGKQGMPYYIIRIVFCSCSCLVLYSSHSRSRTIIKVLQFARRKISASAVAGPLVALLLATVVLLIAWTVHDPLTWARTEVNEYTGESIGQCHSDSYQIYIPLLAVVVAIPTILTCVMAWKTKDVDPAFTESSW